jgi:Asp-tRNA(Asn)/Glu-tRNA(Gln) amidotransferase C subunit
MEDYSQYVKQAAQLIGLELTPEYLPGVIENFERIAKIASLVTEFELSPEIESAPTFEP